ncbi:MAG: uL15m family ribosomal protein, partial [Sulfolobales archaeon]|nr:uL15m family ribosomal protein [Sulfolobales archaeon]
VRQLVSEGKIHREGEFFVLDLSSLGYSKLLGRGKVDFKLKVAVYRATKEAVEKIREAGGEVVLLAKESRR